ncbi:putative uncharacterized protein DDB_G0282133 [Oppia nitens]|uniref:putative uncharacterized protein DDB_G0282133 n=1 Tax=Oppia nitens TaxID=1686743 RepID=UPI0023DB1C17|nr:putative uncharacterized protein DDB_G0282133 [Oppia nitens]
MKRRASVSPPIRQNLPFDGQHYAMNEQSMANHRSYPTMNGQPLRHPMGVNLMPNMGNQRHFTPRSSYLGQRNMTPVFNTSLMTTSAQNLSYNYNPNDSLTPTRDSRGQAYDMMAKANQPVYMTPETNDTSKQKNVWDGVIPCDYTVEQLQDILKSANKETDESIDTTTTNESKDDINVLVIKLSETRDKEEMIKKQRNDTENKIEELDNKLKEFENLINFRENLKKLKKSLVAEEEEIGKKTNELILAIKDLTNNKTSKRADSPKPSSSNNTISSKPLSRPSSDSDITNMQKDKSNDNESIIYKPTIKRSNNFGSNSTNIKKTRFTTDCVSKTSKTGTNNTPTNKSIKTTNVKLTPHPIKHSTNTSNPLLSSPKVNRICRQPIAQNTFKNSVTSGVRTSRPVRTPCGRGVRNTDNSESSNKTTQNVKKSDDRSSVESESTPLPQTNDEEEDLSDSEVFNVLSKKIDLDIIGKETHNKQTTVTESDAIDRQNNEINDKQLREDTTINTKLIDTNKDDNTICNNESNDVELVTIDSDDENIPQIEPMISVKKEREDATKESIASSESNANSLNKDTSGDRSTVCEQTEQNVIPNESTSSSSSPTKKQIKYCGFENIIYEPTVTYTNGLIKSKSGPKSKSISIIVMKSFKDYLIVSFMDSSVLRYRIDDKSNIMAYKGHEEIVFSMIIIECTKQDNTYLLYTGSKDKKLRAFNVETGILINTLEMDDQITCIDYKWSHIFCGLSSGVVVKLSPIHEIDEQSSADRQWKTFVVNSGKRIYDMVCVKPIFTIDNTIIEPIITVTQNKLRVLNTSDSIENNERILTSLSVNMNPPIVMKVLSNHLFVSYSMPKVKNEDKNNKLDNKSKINVYDLNQTWNVLKNIEMIGRIHCLQVIKDYVIASSHLGKIFCIDGTKLNLKWRSSGRRITAFVQIEDRLIYGTEDGCIEVIYLYQSPSDCDTCGITFAREVDLKEHVRIEHEVNEENNDNTDN